jgi:hypothetical protein
MPAVYTRDRWHGGTETGPARFLVASHPSAAPMFATGAAWTTLPVTGSTTLEQLRERLRKKYLMQSCCDWGRLQNTCAHLKSNKES